MTIAGVLLTPGAGASRDSRTLVALERELAPVPVQRIDFPYRLAGRKVPDRAPVAIAHIREQTEIFAADRGVPTDQVVIGGRSYGGRMCSMAVADGLAVGGLLLLSYPLHPPGQPEKLRTEHFPRIQVPVLAISGESDPFGSPAEFATHIETIAGPVTMTFVPGNHDPKKSEGELLSIASRWIAGLGAR